LTSRFPFFRNRNRPTQEVEVAADDLGQDLPPLVDDDEIEQPVAAAHAAQLPEVPPVNNVHSRPLPPLPPGGTRTIVFTFDNLPVVFVATGDFSSSASLLSLVDTIRSLNFDSVLNESFLLHQRQNSGAAPASSEQLGAIQERPVAHDEVGELCPVCQDNLQHEDKVIKLPCSHVFHPDCGLTWLKQHNSCPLCRAALPVAD